MGIQTQIDRIKGEVETQTAQIGTNAALIEQIKAALDGKAAGGGGGASVETCTVTISGYPDMAYAYYYDGSEFNKAIEVYPGTILTVAKNTILWFKMRGLANRFSGTENIEELYFNDMIGSIMVIRGDCTLDI